MSDPEAALAPVAPTAGMTVIQWTITDRGFILGEFRDLHGSLCSIQESSLATESALWVGVSEPYEGARGGHNVRMHLSQEMAAELVDVLRSHAKHGDLKRYQPHRCPQCQAWFTGEKKGALLRGKAFCSEKCRKLYRYHEKKARPTP